MSEFIHTTVDAAIMTIRIQRPQKKNALTADMYVALSAALQQADATDDVHVILITGTEECFTAGNDIADFIQRPISGESSPAVQFLHAISQTNKPIVAAVQGVAIGIGTTLLLHCDLVHAAQTARFQLPFVNLGVVPEGASSLLLPRMMGHQRAAQLLLHGAPFSAQDAYEAGIVTAVHEASQTLAAAQSAAADLASKPPAALQKAKALMKRATADAVQETIAVESAEFAAHLASAEAAAALRAFLERRR